MADLSKVILCLQKIKSKNLGQNQDNLKSFLVKDYEYSPELAENLIDEAVQANIIKSIMFNGKISYRIVKTDSVDDATILVSNTQVDNSEDERTDANTISLEENTTNILEKRDGNVSVLIGKRFSSLIEYIEKRFHILEDQVIGMQNINLPRNAVNSATSENGLYADLLKNWISELKNQLTEKNAVISYLTTQPVTKSQNTSLNQNSCNIDHKKEPQISNSDNVDEDNVEICNKKSKNVDIIGDSMLNNINGKGVSKSKKVDVLNIPGATSGDIVDKIDDALEGKPESLIVHVGTNDLTNNVNLLSNVK